MMAVGPGVGFGATAQLLGGFKPIYFRRSFRTAPLFPKFMSEYSGLFMPERGNAMTYS
jgi:hypothetical protein